MKLALYKYAIIIIIITAHIPLNVLMAQFSTLRLKQNGQTFADHI